MSLTLALASRGQPCRNCLKAAAIFIQGPDGAPEQKLMKTIYCTDFIKKLRQTKHNYSITTAATPQPDQ